MRRNVVGSLLAAALLTGCGMLNIEVDLAGTQIISGSGSTPSPTRPVVASASSVTPTGSPTLIRTEGPSPTGTVAPPAPRAVDIALGKSHSCAVLDSGGVMCWGNNDHKQLGNANLAGSRRPQLVGGVGDAQAVTAGWAHTCVLSKSGGVRCWGYNKNGELGNGGTDDSAVPVNVTGMSSGVVAIEAGDDHTCAVSDDGIVYCWGFNQYGQLGDGSTTSRSVPVPVQGLAADRIIGIAAGWGHTCALTAEKNVRCWGNDEYGQLGYGQTENYRFSPMDLAGFERSIDQISADGGQSCALTIYNGISCWGNNKYGQLGNGTTDPSAVPTLAAGLEQGMRSVTAGWNHTCGISLDGGALCWGWNYYGQVGDGTKASRTTPVAVYGLDIGVVKISLGRMHTCAVTSGGAVACWGANESGQLGDGTEAGSQVPVDLKL
jgi:alpha-tubulin suppressor-like RCC1 family protein